MLKTISDQSKLAYSSELSWFDLPPTSVGINNIRFREINLEHSLNNEGPYVFRINKEANFINLARSYILMEFKVVDSAGNGFLYETTDKDNKIVADDRVSTIQMFGKTFWKQMVLQIGGVQIEDSGPLAPYRTFLNNELLLDEDVKRYNLGDSVFYSAYDNGDDNDKSNAYITKAKMLKDGKTVQLMSGLDFNFCTANRLLLNNIDLQITLHRSPDAFALLAYNNDKKDWKIHIQSLKLMMCEYELYPNVVLALEKALSNGKAALYPMRNSVVKNFYISSGTRETNEITLFNTNQVPRRLFVTLVDSDAQSGDFKKDPFNFNHNKLSNIHIDVAGRRIPTRSWSLDYGNNKYAQAFVQMQEGCGLSQLNRTNGISTAAFKTHRCVYVFDLLPEHDNAEAFDAAVGGTTTLQLSFGQTTTKALQCIVMAHFQGLVSIDRERNATVLPN